MISENKQKIPATIVELGKFLAFATASDVSDCFSFMVSIFGLLMMFWNFSVIHLFFWQATKSMCLSECLAFIVYSKKTHSFLFDHPNNWKKKFKTKKHEKNERINEPLKWKKCAHHCVCVCVRQRDNVINHSFVYIWQWQWIQWKV